MGPLAIDHATWNDILGSVPSYIAVTPTNANDSDSSTADTIKLMQQYSDEDSQSRQVQEAADEIREKAIDHSDRALIDATFEWVKDHVVFVEDETVLNKLFGIQSGVELLIKPSRLLSMNNPMGDCDDFSMLTRSILTNLSIKADYLTVAANANAIGRWSHVYTQAQLANGETIAVDSSHGKYVGWEAPNISRKGLWETNKNVGNKGKDMYINLTGLPDDTSSSDGGGIDWASIFEPLSKAGSQILTAQYGQPQLAPNTYIRQANGAILTNQPITTAGILPAGAGGVGSSLSSILPILGIGLFGLFIFSSMGHR